MSEIITKNDLRKFGLFFGVFIILVIGYFLPNLMGKSFRIWTIFFSTPLLIIAIFKPLLLFYPHKTWIKIAYILSTINSWLILSVVYILFLLPISLIMKIFGHDPLNLNYIKCDSYKIYNNKNYSNLNNIF